MMLSATNEALMATSPISRICQFNLSKMLVKIVCMRMSVHTFVSVYYPMFGKKIPGEQNIPQNVQAWQLEKENTFDPRTLEGGYYKAKCNIARLR